MHTTKSRAFRYLSILLALMSFACMLFGWFEVVPEARAGLTARLNGGDDAVRGLVKVLVDTFKVDMGYMDMDIFVRYIRLLSATFDDFRVTPFELSATVGEVVRIYKLMQLNTGWLEFIFITNESFLAVSAVNTAYVIVLYGTLFYMFWVWARRFYGSIKDCSTVPLVGLILLLAASAAVVIILNGAFGGTVLRLRFWPFLSIGVYVGSVASWRISKKGQAVTTT
ncbi:MAG TPA: hypothetical protein VN512_07195 [Clostridia bacterium]|nr:hypothetical protein [Clostridia bacterium]